MSITRAFKIVALSLLWFTASALACPQTPAYLLVTDYGATINDSSNDDSIGIQAAIDAADALIVGNSGAPTIVFPPGTYHIKTTIHAKSAPWSAFGAPNISTKVLWNGTAGVTAIDRVGCTSGCNAWWTVENMVFREGTAKPGIWLNLTTGGRIDYGSRLYNLQFAGSTSHAITTPGFINSHWDHLRFDGIGGYAIVITPSNTDFLGTFTLDDFTWDSAGSTTPPGFILIDNTADASNLGTLALRNGRIEETAAWGAPKAVVHLLAGASGGSGVANFNIENVTLQDVFGVAGDTFFYCTGPAANTVTYGVELRGVSTQNLDSITAGDCKQTPALPMGNGGFQNVSHTRSAKIISSANGFPQQFLAYTSTDVNLQSLTSADTVGRWTVLGSGAVNWGPGNAAVDVTLQRGAANRLDLLDRLRVTGDSGVGVDFTTDNTADIGSSGANRPRTVHAGTSIVAPAYTVGSTAGVSGTCSAVTVVNGIVTGCTP